MNQKPVELRLKVRDHVKEMNHDHLGLDIVKHLYRFGYQFHPYVVKANNAQWEYQLMDNLVCERYWAKSCVWH